MGLAQMEKSPDAFRTISEVAETLETPAHVLRFWESRFPQIRPVKRAGGRRYYRPSDVALLAGIKRLLHDEGMTIRGVQKILREQGVRHVSGASDGITAMVDAYDILGLAEAAAEAGREPPATTLIDLSAHVRGNGHATARVATDTGGRNGAGATVQEQAVTADETDTGPEAPVGEPVVFAVGMDARLVAERNRTPLPAPVPEATPEPDPAPDPGTIPRAVTPAPAMSPAFGWLATRLRHVPPGGLDDHAEALEGLAARLTDLLNRMSDAARPGHG